MAGYELIFLFRFCMLLKDVLYFLIFIINRGYFSFLHKYCILVYIHWASCFVSRSVTFFSFFFFETMQGYGCTYVIARISDGGR